MSAALRRRVWTTARATADGHGFRIMLDERPLRLPGGTELHLQSGPLADAVAEEWSEAGGGTVGGVFGAESLTLTRLAGTLQERVAPFRDRAIEMLLGYAEGELLCYRALHPASLVARQQAAWQPWLDWCADRHQARLSVTQGVMPVTQPEAAVAALQVALRGQDDAALTGLGILVPALGSLVLGLAIAEGALDAGLAATLSEIDETHELERWGADVEAVARRALLATETRDAARFIELARAAGAT